MKTASLDFEEKMHMQGFARVGGLDEVGRWPLAGPVCACVVVMPEGLQIAGVTDSKAVSEKRRAVLSVAIKEAAIDYALGWSDIAEIDEKNILQATYLAMQRALENLKSPPDALLIDGLQGKWQPDIPSIFIKKGDAASHSIAAASILAKTARDELMLRYHDEYPQYGFDKHKGYGTAKHLAAIREFGVCAIHRRSFLKKVHI